MTDRKADEFFHEEVARALNDSEKINRLSENQSLVLQVLQSLAQEGKLNWQVVYLHLGDVLENVGLLRAASMDELTEIPNRRQFKHDLSTALERVSRTPGHQVTLVLLDANKFKSVNDTLGHPAGDATLFVSAQLIQRSCRRNESVYRFGGDELALIMDADVSSSK